jgi:predicted transcriptional regulator
MSYGEGGATLVIKSGQTAALIESLHRRGVTYQSIADSVGVSWMTVHRWAKEDTHPRPAGPINALLAQMLAG